MPFSYTCTDFLRTLLENCIGTVMIEWEQWNFPSPSFDRGYFNSRLKQAMPINELTHKRLIRLFECVFNPENREGRFQEPQAVEAANALIDLIQNYFHVDLSIWINRYTVNNLAHRSHLLYCLELIFALSEGKETLPVSEISKALTAYLEQVDLNSEVPRPSYPELLSAVPYPQTEHYIGREELTAAVSNRLIDGESCYLHGIGGIGKTEIAKSVLKEILDTPTSDSGITHVLWVDCIDDNFTLSLVQALHLDQKFHNIEQAFQAAIKIINNYKNRLLIVIDNVDSLEHTRESSISEYLHCRVLITSRCAGFGVLTEVPVPPLSLNDCIKLFYAYYHGDRDDITLRKIVELCDCLPLAVELLAKIADAEELLLYEFYETLLRCGFDMSSEEITAAHEKLHSEGTAVQQLSKVFRVYGRCPEEQTLLVQISTIPNIRFLFSQAKRWFLLRNRTPLNHLEHLGWIKKEALYDNGRNRYRYYMHSVIAAAIRAQFIDDLYDLCQGFIHEITIEMTSSLSQNDATKKELIQFSWSLNDIFHGQFQSEEDSDFLWALAEIYRDIGYYERALPLLDSLDTLYCQLYGEGNIKLASVWNSRGMIQYELSHFPAALDAYQTSRDIYEKNHPAGSYSPSERIDLAKLDLNIGKTYLKIDYTKAGTYFDRAYQTLSGEAEAEQHLKLNALAHKAMLLAHSGQLEEAEKIFVDIYNQTDAKSKDREMLLLRAGVAHHIGNIYSDIDPSQAMPYLEEARDIFWKLLSPTHPDTLDVLNSVCSLRLTLEDDYDDILAGLQKLLELFIKAYGPNDPNTGTIYNNIGLCYYYMQRPDEAIENYKKALQIDSLTYGENHESTAYILNNIGGVYSESDHPELAIPEHERALRIYEAAYPNHMNLDLAQTHSDLADAYLREGDADKVMDHLNEAFSIYDKMLPENARQLLQPYSTLANLLLALNEYDESITNYSHVLWLMKENGYTEDSFAFHEFTDRINEVRQLKAQAAATE